MKNLFSLRELSNEEIKRILDDAMAFENGLQYDLSNKMIANLFFEPSTRTQYSFQVAQAKLKMKSINFNPVGSSLTKGESFYDTVKTFASFGIDALVIRHVQNRYYDELKNLNIPIINAGDGTGDHPTQTLLDLYTIYKEFKHFTNLNILIVGDILHSRVAHGGLDIMRRLGMNCYIASPNEYKDETLGYQYVNLNDSIKDMDVIMLLRVQNERHHEKSKITNEEYNRLYGLNIEKVALMKKQAIIMHPAPFNRGVEITDEVVECEKSRIFAQMTNGVFVRQSILKRTFTDE